MKQVNFSYQKYLDKPGLRKGMAIHLVREGTKTMIKSICSLLSVSIIMRKNYGVSALVCLVPMTFYDFDFLTGVIFIYKLKLVGMK